MYPMDCGIEGLYVTYYGRWLTTRGEMSPRSPGVSKISGETQLSLRECGYAHLFEKEGFIDAPPQVPQGRGRDVVRIEEDRPLLEGGANEDAGLLAALMGGVGGGQHMLEAAAVRLLNAA